MGKPVLFLACTHGDEVIGDFVTRRLHEKKKYNELFDVLIGVNLLREGLDLPEVSLVAILDADKEGFLRSERSLIQTIGRAARNVNGRAILYGDRITGSMKKAIDETERRRQKQIQFNEENGITPQSLNKNVLDIMEGAVLLPGKKRQSLSKVAEQPSEYDVQLLARTPDELRKEIDKLENEMYQAAKDLQFEKAASLRDQISVMKQRLLM